MEGTEEKQVDVSATGEEEKQAIPSHDIEKADTTAVPGLHTETKTSTEDGIHQSTILKHVDRSDADEALKLFHTGDQFDITPEQEKRLLRKIDLNIMPLLCVVYGLNYLDKTTLSYASVMGFKASLNLTGSQYNWIASMFYFGYLAWEYPTNRLLQRLPLAKWSAFNVILWGLTLCTMAATSSYGGALAVRFFLGVFESAVTPGFALFTSQWYTLKEQGTRTGIWFSFNGFAQVFGGLVAYGIAKGTEAHPAAIEGWKIVFLTIGLLTASVGVLFLFLMPDSQLNAWFLTPEERIMAVERIRHNNQGVGNRHFKMYQFKEALTDPLTWAFFFYALIADIPNGGISNFFSQLIVTFGYTADQSLLYGAPGGVVEIVTLIASGWLGDKFGNRIIVASSGLVIAIIGMLLVVCSSNSSVRLGGYYLTQASPTPFVCLLSLISSNVAGYTKKTTVAALFLIGYCVGNIIGPQPFQAQYAPKYLAAEVTIIVSWFICLGILYFVYFWTKRRNTLKAGFRSTPGYSKMDGQEFLDLTDGENPEFIYTL